MINASQDVFHLSTPNVGIKQAKRCEATQCTVAPAQPSAGGLHTAEGRRGNVSDESEPVESIRLDWREQPLMFAAGKRSFRNAHDGANIS